ncbi:sugar ABC transporter ATP-binding protein [Roseibium salinum]|uniref:Sugar ABC transporter ATP-binding protein n=1 Tax=Roseibium salinum TaxID=1604349 RepID=A0ABT3QWS4_9HYPH|nr:sugar ABC transporter ATP-binding protein [Roseibium sp. DSM 29163]MCX2721366.1 sugar ABC transporter ATP-binding protein [Roseibium sp. DSM 29163]
MHPGFQKISLELSRVTKVYPGVVALQDVDLSIQGGEIVGLIGENGAGKSTLMKVLGGTVSPDGGRYTIDGVEVGKLTPSEAAALGIAFVHQELNPFTNLDVTANVLLGREMTSGPLRLLDRQAMVDKVRPILQLLGARFGPGDPVSDLSLADQQLLEIARALSMNARLVILDEPTSSLTLSETERLLEVMRQLRERGVAVLFISHRLTEVEDIADRVVCLRDGNNAGELTGAEIRKETMVRMMIGRDVSQFYEKSRHRIARPVLEMTGVRTSTFPGAAVNLSLHGGEILGIAGLVGAGRTELARAIFGIDKLLGGSIRLDGKALQPHSVPAAIAAGLSLVPEDRKEQGLLLDFPIYENLTLPCLNTLSRFGVVDRARENELAESSRRRLSIKAGSLSSAAAELSGGNQQKVVLAKWLAMNPKVIIFDEPTRGIDVGAKAEVYHLMQALTEEGVGILMISSDMEEVIGVSHRVAVMRRGHVSGILNSDELTEENILRLAVG